MPILVAMILGCTRSTSEPPAPDGASAPEAISVVPPLEPPALDDGDPGASPGDAADFAGDDEGFAGDGEGEGEGDWDGEGDGGNEYAWVGNCGEPGCAFTVTFRDAVKADDPAITLSPEIAGAWSWRDDRTAQFTPNPDALTAGTSVTVSVASAGWDGYLDVPPFSLAGKVASWPVVVGQPRFVGFLNHFSLGIGQGPLLVIYDQPVKPAEIAKRLTFADGAKFTVAAAPSAVPYATPQTLPAGHVVAVTLTRPPEDGGTIEVKVPTWGDDDWSSESWPLDVRRTVSVASVVDSDGQALGTAPVGLDARLELTLTGSVESALASRGIRVVPEPVGLDVSAWGEQVVITATLDPGVDYELHIDPTLQDALGNKFGAVPDAAFRSRDLEPFLALPAQPITSELGRASLEVHARNVAGLTAKVFPVSAAAYALGAENGVATCASIHPTGPGATLTVPKPPKDVTNEIESIDVAVGAAGPRCVEISGQGAGSEASGPLSAAILVQNTDLGVTAKVYDGHVFAWVTKLGKPAPVAGAKVVVYDDGGGQLANGVTDADGIAVVEASDAHGYGVDASLYLAATSGTDTAVVALREDRLSPATSFGVRGAVEGVTELAAALFTERGAYRPGETARVTLMGGPRLANQSASITVTDPRGQEVVSDDVRLDAFGTGSLAVPTRSGAPVGRYDAIAAVGEATANAWYRVEEYRVPTFQVKVASEAEEWPKGKPVTASLSAAYLQGGTLDGRQMSWVVVRSPEPFAPPAFPRFAFGLGDPSAVAGAIASGAGRLDGTGVAAVTFTPSHPSSAGPVRYTVEATVTDVDRQAWSGRTSRVVHPAMFYVGVKPPLRSVVSEGDVLDVPVVAVDPTGKRVDGAIIRVRLERIDHHTTSQMGRSGAVQTTSSPVAVPSDACLVTTGPEPVSCAFTVPSAGRWRVRAWAQDGRGNDVQSGFEVDATGDEPAAWPRFDRERIEVRADKPTYAPGETAHLVVETPFDEATGLLTLERDGVLSHRVFTIRKDTPSLDVPLDASAAPNVFATVVLLRGRMHDQVDATGFETGAPSFRIGVTELVVSRAAQRLNVGVAPSPAVSEPKATVSASFTVADPGGKPVEGQAVVMVVDEAVLGLTGYATPDPVASLFPVRPLGVRSGDSRLELPNALRSRREELFPGGDGGDLGPLPGDLLRSLFESTAFFDAAVPVHAGNGSVTFTLPDQTTTFRVMVVAVDAGGRGGSADAVLVVRRPLTVQAVAPRFVMPGDKLRVEALIHADRAGGTDVSASFEGLRATGPTAGSVQVTAGGTAKFPVDVEVTGKGTAKIRFVAKQGTTRQDAVEVTLPILEPGASRSVVESATVSGDQKLSVVFPADRVKGTEQLEIVASTTSLTALKDAIGYLMGYPNGCIEQTTSTAYPLVVLEDLLPEIGVDVDRKQLREYSEAGVRRILSFQTDQGGLSYWPGGTEPHAFATAFGLTALIEARHKGYDVPDKDLARMGDFLEASLAKGEITGEMPHAAIADGDTRALFVMTLGRLGRPQPAWIERLWSDRSKLTAFGLSFLEVSAQEIDPHHPLIDPIRAEIAKAAKRQADEAWFEGDRSQGWSMDSPLRTHAASLLAFSTGGDLGGPLLTGLLDRQEGGMWGNTQENVFGIMGVRAVAARSKDGGTPAITLTRSSGAAAGAPIDLRAMEAPSARVRRLTLGSEALGLGAGAATQTITANTTGKPVNLTVRARYDVQLTPENRAPQKHAIAITRTVETTEGAPVDLAAVPLGTLVRVRLVVTNDAPLHYVAIDDRLPAGLEPLNMALATTERASLGAPTPEVTRMLPLLSYTEIRDARVAFYADELPAGTYEVRYLARATTPGTFLRAAARAEAMYDPDVWGTTAIDTVVVK